VCYLTGKLTAKICFLLSRVLLMAHSLLAKYSLCTSSDGQLLQYTVQKLQEHKQSSECNNPQLTEQLVNQCIYCLYGHPNKKVWDS